MASSLEIVMQAASFLVQGLLNRAQGKSLSSCRPLKISSLDIVMQAAQGKSL
jgi:hypothetical protein